MKEVHVVVHTHRHGANIAVCATAARAQQWIKETVAEEWSAEMGKRKRPKVITDQHVSDYEAESRESFEVEVCEVLL